MFRAHLGEDDANRFGSRVVRFVAPLIANTPEMDVPFGVSEYRGGDDGAVESRTVDVAFPPTPNAQRFLADVQLLDDQLMAAAEALGVDPRDYSPLVRRAPCGPVMKIKLSPASSAELPRRSKSAFVVRMDHVWFVGARWGATWRQA